MAYAVMWSEAAGPEFVGKLDLGLDCIILTGIAAEARESRRRVPFSEVTDASLGALARLSGGERRGLLLTLAHGRVEIASLEGMGALHELAEHISAACGKLTSRISSAADVTPVPEDEA